MANEKHWLKRRMVPLTTFLFAALLYLAGGLCAERGDWVHVAGYLTGSLMLTIVFATDLVRQRLDERLRRLEQLLAQQRLAASERANHSPGPEEDRIPQ
jgi:hypothetical protein